MTIMYIRINIKRRKTIPYLPVAVLPAVTFTYFAIQKKVTEKNLILKNILFKTRYIFFKYKLKIFE